MSPIYTCFTQIIGGNADKANTKTPTELEIECITLNRKLRMQKPYSW